MPSINGITKNLRTTDLSVVKDDVYVKSNVMNGKPGLLLIWGDFCSHCVKFKPTYIALSAKLNKDSVKFPCLAIESEELKHDQGLSSALNFQGFPTLKVVGKDGKVLGDYNEGRDLETLTKNVCKIYHYCA